MLLFAAFAGADPASEISAKQSQAETVRSEIADLNSGLEAKVESYNQAQVELGHIKNSIAANQIKINEASVNLETARLHLEGRVVSIYRNGSVELLDVLMQTSDINDFMSTYDMLAKLGQQDRDDLEQVKLYKSQVEDAQAKLADDQSRQSDLVDQIASEKAAIQSGIKEKQSMLTGIQGDIDALQKQKDAEEKQRAFQASLAAAARNTNNNNSGGNEGNESAGRSSAPPPPASSAGGAVGIAMRYLGVPYVWGGADPSGFDCSGLVMYVYAQLGVSLPHSAAGQYAASTPISYDELQPGDLVFYNGLNHVAIYIGNGQIIQAPFEGEVVSISPVSGGGSYYGAGRV